MARRVTGRARLLLDDAERRLATIADPLLAVRFLTQEGALVQAQLALQAVRDAKAIRSDQRSAAALAVARHRGRKRLAAGGELTAAEAEALEEAGELEATA